MMRPLAFVLGIALLVPVLASAQEADQVGEFMRAKLKHSQSVLEGLALEDFDAIAKNSQAMALLSQASSWQVLQTPEYSRQSADFRHACQALTKAATEKNLEGSTLAFMELTMRCVSCHKYVRRTREARADASLQGLLKKIDSAKDSP